MHNRKYKSGTRWCFWRWTDVDSEYIVRLHVLKTPWFALCLHWILKPDPEPYLHDHPVTFLSIILRGGYNELRSYDGGDTHPVQTHTWYNWVRANRKDCHSIIKVKPHTLTLCFMGPKVQEWGFHRRASLLHDRPKDDVVLWKAYYAAKRKGVQL